MEKIIYEVQVKSKYTDDEWERVTECSSWSDAETFVFKMLKPWKASSFRIVKKKITEQVLINFLREGVDWV